MVLLECADEQVDADVGHEVSTQVDAIEKTWQGCHGNITQNGPSGSPVVFDVGEVTRSATDPSIVLLSSTVQNGPKLMVGSRSSVSMIGTAAPELVASVVLMPVAVNILLWDVLLTKSFGLGGPLVLLLALLAVGYRKHFAPFFTTGPNG